MHANNCLKRTIHVCIAGLLGMSAGHLAAAQNKQALSINQTINTAALLNLYISNNGNDAWSGRLAAPNQSQNDGPFKTLRRARDHIRQLKQAGKLSAQAVTVNIRGGDYLLNETFELSAEDSGAKDRPVIYRAYENETVRLIAGRRVANFRPVTDPNILNRLDASAHAGVMQADLKDAGITDFGEVSEQDKMLQLFFQNEPMTLARWPNKGYIRIIDTIGGQPVKMRRRVGDKIGKFTYRGDRPKRWQNEKDVYLHGFWFWDWAGTYEKVESIDTENRIITTAPPYHRYGYRSGQRFFALNILAELNSPGEWYLDRQSGILYFWPPNDIASSEAVLSMLETAISMTDVSHVRFDGLTIGFNRGTAVTITNGQYNKFVNCTLQNMGGKAVIINGGGDHAVENCHISNTGFGAIELTGGDREKLIPSRHSIVNNHIHHFSRLQTTYGTAVIALGVGSRIAHNVIHDAPHMAIFIRGNDHLIEYNEIYRVCLETEDAGAFYIGRDWTARGNVVRYNYFHHLNRDMNHYGVQAVFLDDFTSDVTVYGNICYKVYRGVLLGGGRDNTIENNIFIDCDTAIHIDSRGIDWAKDYFDGSNPVLFERLNAMPYKQPPWSQRYPQLLTLCDDEPALAKYNKVLRNIAVDCGTWLDLEKELKNITIQIEDNLVGKDPHFMDRHKEDFRLQSDSPAFEKGFQQIPTEKIGLYKPCKKE